MAHQLQRNELDFLTRLGKSPDGEFLRQILSERLKSLDQEIRALDGTGLYRTQGRAQELADLLGLLSAAQAKRPPATVVKAMDQAFVA